MANNKELIEHINEYSQQGTDVNRAQEIIDYIIREEHQWCNLTPDFLCKLLLILVTYYNDKKDYQKAYKLFIDYCTTIRTAEDVTLYCQLILLAVYALENIKSKEEELLHLNEEYIYYSCKGKQPLSDVVLYSFRNEFEYTFADLEGNKLTFANPRTFNDPLDTILYKWLDSSIDRTEGKSTEPFYLKRAAENLKARCFVSPETTTGELTDIENINPLMWAHYANCHKGICIRYCFKRDFFQQDPSVRKFVTLHHMTYDKQPVKMTDSISINQALYSKNPIWEYENETRIITYDTASQKDYEQLELNNNANIEAIYLGVKCSDATREHVQLILRGTSIPLFQMQINEDDVYKLIAKRIG